MTPSPTFECAVNERCSLSICHPSSGYRPLTVLKVRLERASHQRHWGKLTQRLLHDALHVLQLAQITHIDRPTAIRAQHLQNLGQQLGLNVGMPRDAPQAKGYGAGRGIVALEHERVHLLAYLLVPQRTSIHAGLQQHIQQRHAPLAAHRILAPLRSAAQLLRLLQSLATLLDYPDGKFVHGAYELRLTPLQMRMRQREEQLVLQIDGHKAPGHQRSASVENVRVCWLI